MTSTEDYRDLAKNTPYKDTNHQQPIIDKAAIRRMQQKLRARRYRARLRERLAQQQELGTADKSPVPATIPIQPLCLNVTPDDVGTKATINPKENPVPKINQSQQKPKSFWAPSLDDKTKYMMRENSLVVGFVWKTDKHGDICLTSTKVIRSGPRSLRAVYPRRKVYTEDILQKFTFKLESPLIQKTVEPYMDDLQPLDYDQRKVLEITPTEDNVKEEAVDVGDEPLQSNRICNIKQRLFQKKCLTSAQYALYRYIIACSSSPFYIYRWNVAVLESTKSTRASSLGAKRKKKPVTQLSLRVTRALSCRLSRLRARLKICSSVGGKLREQQMLDMVISSDEHYSDISSYLEEQPQLPVKSTRGRHRTGNQARANWNLALPKRKVCALPNLSGSESSDCCAVYSETLDNRVTGAGGYGGAGCGGGSERSGRSPKILKAKWIQEKILAEQDQWEYDEDSDEQQNQIRTHRYRYQKAAKQSNLYKTNRETPTINNCLESYDEVIDVSDDIATTSLSCGVTERTALVPGGTAAPQIISIESLEDESVQALSWEVIEVSDDAETSEFFFKHQYQT